MRPTYNRANLSVLFGLRSPAERDETWEQTLAECLTRTEQNTVDECTLIKKDNLICPTASTLARLSFVH